MFDWYDYGARFYDPQLGRWHVPDPMAEKYFNFSPYTFCLNNPLLYLDPNGEEIWIYYIDSEGKEQKFMYNQGMESKGNKFSKVVIDNLNKMSRTELGAKLLESLISTENAYDFKNIIYTDENGKTDKTKLNFVANENGGGTINAGALLEGMENYQAFGAIAHELFHGYQDENNQGGASIMNEVEAYLYEYSVQQEAFFKYEFSGGVGSTVPSGRENFAGLTWEKSVSKLYNSDSFSKIDFINAVISFKRGSIKNLSGSYSDKPLILKNQRKSMISRFYPLIR